MKKHLVTMVLTVCILSLASCGKTHMADDADLLREEFAVITESEDKVATDAEEDTVLPTEKPAATTSPADEPESIEEQPPVDEPESIEEQPSAAESEPAEEQPSAADPLPAQEPGEIPAVTEKPVEVTAPEENMESASEPKTEVPDIEEVDAKTAAARAKIAAAEANGDFFSCTPQDYVDAGYLSEETARALMQGMEQPALEAPVPEATVSEVPAPAVSADIFGKINNMTDAQYAAVLPILQDMAATALATGTTDLDHVRAAAQMVYAYAANAVYTTEGNYNKPYGLIFEGVYTCAATCRTTAMVLMLMGYPDVTAHNLSQWSHQWVTLTIDGQAGWADGIAGIADYGTYPLYGDGAPGYYEDPVTGLTWY